MKFLYVTDLHGDKNKYERILEIAIQEKIKLIVNGGDLFPKTGDRHFEQPDFIEGFLPDYFKKLTQKGIAYISILGNDDLLLTDKLYSQICAGSWFDSDNDFHQPHYVTFKKIHNLDHNYPVYNKPLKINGYEFIGMHNVLDHPFGCKDRVVYETPEVYQQRLSNFVGISNENRYSVIDNWDLYKRTKLPVMKDILDKLPTPENPNKTIYVMHMPPAGLRLGQLYHQDLDVGSYDISNFILQKQPLLTLHGHIHEAPITSKGKWINSIDKTTCIQPGQTELGDNKMVYVKIDLKQMIFERKISEV